MAPVFLAATTLPPDPAAGHTHTIIFLHGHGSSGRDLIEKLDAIFDRSGHRPGERDSFLSVRWVFPQAVERECKTADGRSVSQWFDVSESGTEDRAGLRESVASVRAIVDREAAKLGGRHDRVVLAGVSQGGATAVHTLLNISAEEDMVGEKKLAALICFCAWMPARGMSLAETRKALGLDDAPNDDEVVKKTPVYLSHCVDDEMAGIAEGRKLRDALQGFGACVKWKEYADGKHCINVPQGVEDFMTWLKERL